MKSMTKFFAITALAVLAACGRVPSGHEGVKVNLYGSDRGVQTEETGVGWVWVGPGHELYIFPTFRQNIAWSGDQSICFQDKDGLRLCANIGMDYYVEPGRADDVFIEFRKGIDEITAIFLKNRIQNAFNMKTSVLSAEQIYSTKKNELLEAVNKTVKDEAAQYGIVIQNIYIVDSIALPETVRDSINSKIKATQIAQQRRNEVEASKAEADKLVEKARGENEARKMAADAEAYSIQVTGDMLNKYPSVLRLREVQKWDGKYPTTLVGDSAADLLITTGK